MNKLPPHDFDHLWNDMPYEERQRLMPHFLEAQILHIWQTKQKAIASHKKFLAEMNDWENNIRNSLNNYKRELNVSCPVNSAKNMTNEILNVQGSEENG